jgi:hypothetical protein
MCQGNLSLDAWLSTFGSSWKLGSHLNADPNPKPSLTAPKLMNSFVMTRLSGVYHHMN